MNQQTVQTAAPVVFPCACSIKEEVYRLRLPKFRVAGLKGRHFTAINIIDGKVVVDPRDLRPGVNALAVCAELVEFDES